ncbi:hypothetical protein KAR91_27500 [Candidatus Pacearchaeota archaeon]|nr:hypothetical protein [Candidatus Pacearchaeota archaeon]
MSRKRPRKTKTQIESERRSRTKTILQALGGDIEALDNLFLPLTLGNGVGVKDGRLRRLSVENKKMHYVLPHEIKWGVDMGK